MHKFKSSLAVLAAAISVAGGRTGANQDHHRHTDVAAQYRPHAGHRRQGTRPVQEGRPRCRYRVARRRGQKSIARCSRAISSSAHARRADDYRPLERRGGESAVRQSAEIRSVDGCARRDQDDGRSQGQAYRHPEPGGFADILSRSVLRAAKIDPKEVNFVSIASEDVPALVADQVDTAILHVEREMIAKSKVPDLHAIARM